MWGGNNKIFLYRENEEKLYLPIPFGIKTYGIPEKILLSKGKGEGIVKVLFSGLTSGTTNNGINRQGYGYSGYGGGYGSKVSTV
jgi:hypothetical protein